MRSLCAAEVYVTLNSIKVLSDAKKTLLWRICVAGKKYLNRQVKCLQFLHYFNQISIFSTDFHRSP